MQMTNIVAIIEARMGSERLPGKTLMDVSGKPLIERVIDRIKLAKSVTNIVVATSVNEGDDPIADFCKEKKINFYKGSEDDVLDRVYKAAKEFNADIVAQMGADCPFYDGELIDLLVNKMTEGGYDYASNDMKLTFPEGVYAHLIKMSALEVSAKEAKDKDEREDTPRFIWNNPERFKMYTFEASSDDPLNRPDIRLTVDYKEDMELTRKIYDKFARTKPKFSTKELINFLDKNPELKNINKKVQQKKVR